MLLQSSLLQSECYYNLLTLSVPPADECYYNLLTLSVPPADECYYNLLTLTSSWWVLLQSFNSERTSSWWMLF